MSEIIKCSKCSFTGLASEWGVSLHGKKFKLCASCRMYFKNKMQDNPVGYVKKLEAANFKYLMDESFRKDALSRYDTQIICDFCGKEMRLSSLRAHLICCKRKVSPELAMLKRLSDVL
jgi:predicted restriction endonuclease